MFSYIESIYWSSEDKGAAIEIQNRTRLKYIGSEIDSSNLIRTTKPVFSKLYFEVALLDCGTKNNIAIGFTQGNQNTTSGNSVMSSVCVECID